MRLLFGSPVQVGIVDQAADRSPYRQVALHQGVEQPVLLPGGVGEATVAPRRRDLRASERHSSELGTESADAARHAVGAAYESGRDPARSARAKKTAGHTRPDGGVREHYVERGSCRRPVSAGWCFLRCCGWAAHDLSFPSTVSTVSRAPRCVACEFSIAGQGSPRTPARTMAPAPKIECSQLCPAPKHHAGTRPTRGPGAVSSGA